MLGTHGAFRDYSTPFNPTGTEAPFFQVFSRDFLRVLGPAPKVRLIAEHRTWNFAHEAPIWVPETDEVFFSSTDGGYRMSGVKYNNHVSKIHLKEAEENEMVSFTKVRDHSACLHFLH